MSMESIPEFRPPEPPEDDSLDQSLRTEVTAIALANVKTIQALTSEKLPEFASNLIPQHHMPTSAYMNALSPSERGLASVVSWSQPSMVLRTGTRTVSRPKSEMEGTLRNTLLVWAVYKAS